MRRLWGRLGLRARITLLFALGGLMLSITIAVATLTLARQNLIDDREQGAFAVVIRNAQTVEGQLTEDTDPENLTLIFESLTLTERSHALIRLGEEWTASQTQKFNADSVPMELISQVRDGNAAQIRTRVDDQPTLITGLPMPDLDADYYEASGLGDVEDALDTLIIIVVGVAAAATLLSAAMGSWASRRTLTPLVEVRAAAESLAAGELDTRLDPPADADLASLSASFNGMARALEDRIERDARFASEVSHELRSPLMTLNASAEVLNNRRDDLSERNRTALDLLTDDISRFTDLVEDLLEISRYDVGTAALQDEPIDLVEFVRQAVAHGRYPDTAVDINELEHLVIMGDKRRLAQVVANLLDNAAKYGTGQVRIEIRELDETAQIAVEDEGPGVPPDERGVIFDRFSRGSAGGRRGQGTGSGLGLSLVTEHVGLHGGHVWAEDRPDGLPGARFVVSLPKDELE